MLLLNCVLLKCSLEIQRFLANTFASRYVEWPCRAGLFFGVQSDTGTGLSLVSFHSLSHNNFTNALYLYLSVYSHCCVILVTDSIAK